VSVGLVRTVRGDLPGQDLGATLIHEHLLTAPPPYAAHADPDLEFGSEEGATSELQAYAGAGGGALIELTTVDYGRDAGVAARASAGSGVHVVQATGLQKGIYYPAGTSRRSVEDLAAQFERDIVTGIDASTDGEPVRAGVVKVGSCSTEALWPVEETVLRAGARAARRTGAPVQTHTQAGRLGHEQLDQLESEGLPPSQVCLGHLDRNLEWDYLLSLAERGAWLGLDQWTKDKYGLDVERAAMVRRLVDAGHTRVLVSGDLGRGSYQPAYGGGPGFGSCLTTIRKVIGDDDLADLVLVRGPREFLAFREPARG
jgi:predicted metal-dependent phosphotriesterase family hydrolase